MTVTLEAFKKLDIRIGRVLSAERVEGTDKLIKLQIDLGTEKRQVVAGMADFLEPDHFIGKEVPVLTNLEPRTLRGVESQGMVLAAEVGGRPVLLLPEDEVPPGSVVR